jgi:ParB family chromosome partitioning protein
MPATSRTARQVAKQRKTPRRRKATPVKRGLSPAETGEAIPDAGRALAEAVVADGGRVLAVYREPLGGHAVLFAALPVDKVQPTRTSATSPSRTSSGWSRRWSGWTALDPLIAVRHEGSYWTPNGNHRRPPPARSEARRCSRSSCPSPRWRSRSALNTEKAHNLKERSLEVIRMLRGLVEARKGTELDVAPLLEEPAFATLGAAYEQRPRLSAGRTTPSSSASTASSTSLWPRR